MWRSIHAIISSRLYLRDWLYRPGLWLLVCCLWGLFASAAWAETLHFWGEQLELDAQGGRLEGQRQARLFWGDYQLLANQIVWDTSSQRYLARGEVTFRSAVAEVKAEAMELLLAQGQLIAKDAELNYLGQIQARAASLWLSEEVWHLEQVHLQLSDSPLQVQVRHLRLLPQTTEQILLLEDLQVLSMGLFSPTIAYLEWPLRPQAAVAEIRNPIEQFQPQLGWQNGQLQVGLNAQIWQDAQQRLYLQTGSSLLGWQGVLSHEWRPQPDTLINTQLGLLGQNMQGHLQALYKTPFPIWLEGGLRWQEPDRFAQNFWLPELVQSQVGVSALDLLASSEYSYWGDLQYRYLLGGRWSPDVGTQAGLSLLGNLPLFQGWGQELWGSLLANGFYEQGLQATAGVRILDRWQISSQWQSGVYLEQYLSSWPAERFLQSGRLTPWLGAFVRWQAHEDLALVFESALSLSTGQPVLADALLTWQVKPFYLNLMLRGFPLGAQVQVQLDQLGF